MRYLLSKNSKIMNKTIRSGARKIIFNVFLRCLAESEAGTLLSELDDVYQRTAEFTGVSIGTVRNIVNEGENNGGVFSTPGKHRKGRPRKDLDNFDLSAIRQKVQFFYTVMKKVPTLRSLLPVVREDLGFDGSRENLRKVLLGLGFSYKKCQSDRSALKEMNHVAAKREEYLKIIIENRSLPEELQKDVVYLDESYVHSSYKLKKCWQSLDICGVKENVSKGKRYIIIHAGSKKGFVPNALLIFSGKNQKEDYHSEMNQTNFTKWVREKLIPNLSIASIIVMDNAPYHSIILNKAPTSSARVDDLKLWLVENNIQFDPSLRKPSLVNIVKANRPKPIYEIDQILADHGHTVVRLPPYHCDLNPIELIWGIAKHKIASNNVCSTDIKVAAEQAFQEITAEIWENSCKHVQKIEQEYYERGQTLYTDMDELIINLNDESSESSDAEYEIGVNVAPRTSSNEPPFSGVEFLDEEFLV